MMRRLRGERALAVALTVFCALIAATLVIAAIALSKVQEQGDKLATQSVQLRVQAVQIAGLARDSNQALCALRRGLEGQVKQTDVFLRHHPEGFAGVSAATLRLNEERQRGTIKALSNLRCAAPHR